MRNLFEKYDIPTPRYTSYPTVPYWDEIPTTEQWVSSLRRALKDSTQMWSAYIHIPFCETMCTFCGCNTVITKNHKVEHPYVQSLLKEQDLYFSRVPELQEAPLVDLHLGGGSPTFLASQELERLLRPLLARVRKAEGFEASLEVDPRRTRVEQLEVLRGLGFQRLSLGVQDFNPEVQRLINRHQTFEQTESILKAGRALDYHSINFDLIYGLPAQTPVNLRETILRTIDLRPDRIALYSFALVPWIKPAQRLFKDEDLPMGEAKRRLYEDARQLLIDAGYLEIGMDHFALPTDALAKAAAAGKLHRNFMGYTDRKSQAMVGFGVSSISETPDCYHQNEKVLSRYESQVASQEIPTFRGHCLNQEDQQQKRRILDLMTLSQVDLPASEQGPYRTALSELEADGLIRWTQSGLFLTEKGRPFLRNVCTAFDLRLQRKKAEKPTFSKSL